MFRLSNLISSVVQNKKSRVLNGSIAIWNFTNRCNLSCLHCYSKADLSSRDTLTTDHIISTLPKLKENGIKFLIFSGGEPLTRKDIYDIADACKKEGIMTYLSTHGLYVNKGNVQKIVDTFNYIGISIDGDEKTHDYFRGLKGSFKKSIEAVKLVRSTGAKVGIRFTITKDTYGSLEYMFKLAEEYDIPKIYISHLVYSGRGLENLEMDLTKEQRRKAVNFILDKAFEYHETGREIEVVTGNMEQDAILFLEKFGNKYPELKDEMKNRLCSWGGNSAGRKLLNIDSLGNVKPDPFFPLKIGNVLNEDFTSIWKSKNSELLTKLRQTPRNITGICEECNYLNICNGGSRSRANAIYEDLWTQDPSCYLSNEERRGIFQKNQ